VEEDNQITEIAVGCHPLSAAGCRKEAEKTSFAVEK
jgi:hypothetical protein